ncbi:MAG: DUF2188 domain-containing protein [Deltaproteobacteria bacterium]|nr:DUF2188 domain-containing protein [Deltaproteobacteria bacterium]
MQTKKRTLKAPTATGKIPLREIRAAVRAIHVVPNPGGGWEVKKLGARRLVENFPSKREALEFARSIGKRQHVELVIHERDGNIEWENLPEQDLKN